MKNALNIFKIIVALLCIPSFFLLNACNSPVASAKHTQANILKKVDKTTLLAIVADLSANMSKNHCSVLEAKQVLKFYSSAYKINVTGMSEKFNNDAEYLSIYLLKDRRDTSELFFCSLSIPPSLYRQMTFSDLKNRFGNWENAPAITRPIDAPYILTSFNYKNAPGISIVVESKKLPEDSDNSVEQIKISPSTL